MKAALISFNTIDKESPVRHHQDSYILSIPLVCDGENLDITTPELFEFVKNNHTIPEVGKFVHSDFYELIDKIKSKYSHYVVVVPNSRFTTIKSDVESIIQKLDKELRRRFFIIEATYGGIDERVLAEKTLQMIDNNNFNFKEELPAYKEKIKVFICLKNLNYVKHTDFFDFGKLRYLKNKNKYYVIDTGQHFKTLPVLNSYLDEQLNKLEIDKIYLLTSNQNNQDINSILDVLFKHSVNVNDAGTMSVLSARLLGEETFSIAVIQK